MYRQREVRVTEKFFITIPITSTDVVTTLGTLGVDGASLFANSVSLANLGDMFRLFRVNAAKFKLVYCADGSVTAYNFPPSLLYILPFGAAAPAGVASLESDRAVGDLTEGARFLTTSPAIMAPCSPVLKVKNSDLVVIDSASPVGWLATGLDATQGHFGTLYLIKTFAGASTGVSAPYWCLQVEVDISFRDLVDPTLISRQKSLTRSVKVAEPQKSLIMSAVHPAGCRCSTCKT